MTNTNHYVLLLCYCYYLRVIDMQYAMSLKDYNVQVPKI